jgi:hypothetical protein
VDADAPVDLVVEPDLAILLILVAGQLDAVHAEVRVHDPRLRHVLRVDLWKGDERAAVPRPVHDLRQFRNARSLQGRCRAAETHATRQRSQCSGRNATVTQRRFEDAHGVVLELNQRLHALECVPENEPRTRQCTEQVGDGRKRRALHTLEEERGPTRGVDPHVNGCHLEVRIHLLADAHQVTTLLQVLHTRCKAAVAHRRQLLSGFRGID